MTGSTPNSESVLSSGTGTLIYNQHCLPLQLAVKAINRPVFFHRHGLTDQKSRRGVLNFELGTDVRPEVSTTSL